MKNASGWGWTHDHSAMGHLCWQLCHQSGSCIKFKMEKIIGPVWKISRKSSATRISGRHIFHFNFRFEMEKNRSRGQAPWKKSCYISELQLTCPELLIRMTLVRQVSVFFLSLSYFFCAKMPIKKCFQRFSGIRFELNSVEWIPDSTPVDCVIKLRR